MPNSEIPPAESSFSPDGSSFSPTESSFLPTGSPADRTIVQSDDLFMNIVAADPQGTPVNHWAKVSVSGDKPDGIGIGEQGPGAVSPMPALANFDYPTAAGRFRDPNSDRVLSFRLTAVGGPQRFESTHVVGGRRLLVLSSDTSSVNPQWFSTPGPSCNEVGQTCEIPGLGAVNDVGDTSSGVVGVTAQAGSDAAHQWTLLGVPGAGGDVRLENRSDGLCLQPNGLLGVELGQCDPGNGSQVWQLRHDSPDDLSLIQARSREEVSANGNAVVLRRPGAGAKSFPARGSSEPGGAIPTWSTFVGPGDETPYAMATGDLDRWVSDDAYHDEAVVAYADAEHRLQVRVIDYNANADHLLVTKPNVELPKVGGEKDYPDNRHGIRATNGKRYFDGSVGVAVGSFAGDDKNEIAVTWQDQNGLFHVTMLRYQATDSGGRELTVVGAGPDGITLFKDASKASPPTLVSGWAKTTAGELDRGGLADLAITYAANNDEGRHDISGHLGVVSLTPDLAGIRGEAHLQFSVDQALFWQRDPKAGFDPHAPKVVTGLFRYDPAQGFSNQRRELAVAWTEQGRGDNDASDYYQIFDVEPQPGTAEKPIACGADSCPLQITAQSPRRLLRSFAPVSRLGEYRPISLAAGGFGGPSTDGSPPLWSLAIALPPASGSGGGPAYFAGESGQADLVLARPNKEGDFRVFGTSQELPRWEQGRQYVLTAYDREGKSLEVGAPTVATIDQFTRASLIAAEPPVQADWLPTADGGGAFQNVSRKGNFVVSFGKSSLDQFKSQTTDKSAWNAGVTQSASFQLTYAVGAEKISQLKGSAGAEQSFEHNWSGGASDTFTDTQMVKQTATATSADDDIIQGDYSTYYVYRYPILGMSKEYADGKPCGCTPFYQVTVPGQITKVEGPGRDFAWYQPTWENGNVLSYPRLTDGGKVPTPDIGSYETVRDGKKVATDQPLFNKETRLGGTAGTQTLEISNENGQEHTSTTGREWQLSLEATASLSYSLGDPDKGTGSRAEGSFSIGGNGGQVFGHSDVATTTSSSSNAFTLSYPTVDANKSYLVGTAYYYDKAGAAKVVSGVDLTGSAAGRDYWEQTYGREPDPALNLPNAIVRAGDVFGSNVNKLFFNTNPNAQWIRGFQALQPGEPGSSLTAGEPYASDPVNGDKVIFSVRVHNFSLIGSPSVPVQFWAVPVDQSDLEPLARQEPELISAKASGPLDPQGMTTVQSSPWTAKTLGNALQRWRIFVVVDPDDKDVNGQPVREIHPLKGGKPCPSDSLDPNAAAKTVVNQDGTVRMIDPMTGRASELACGQNNQGYQTITVIGSGGKANTADKSLAARFGELPAGARLQAMAVGRTPAVPTQQRLAGTRLVDATPGHQNLGGRAGIPTIRAGHTLIGVVETTSKVTTTDIEPLLIYDGPPADNDLIDATSVDGASAANGGDETFDWVASRPGVHTIHEILLGSTHATDSYKTVKIRVLAARHANHGHGNPGPRFTG